MHSPGWNEDDELVADENVLTVSMAPVVREVDIAGVDSLEFEERRRWPEWSRSVSDRTN